VDGEPKKSVGPWLTIVDAAEYFGIGKELLNQWVLDGKVKSIQHPVHKARLAIPFTEVQRILGVGTEIIVPYTGRCYPYQTFLFYLAVNYGRKIKLWKQHLVDLKFPAPPDDELRAIAESTMRTAPGPVRVRMKRLKPFRGAEGYEEWVDRLGLTEAQEDLFEFVPMNIVANPRVRWIVEICGSAGMKPMDVCEAVRRVADILIEPTMIKNYLWMFHYIRQMSAKDWDQYVEEERKRNDWKGMVREECVDNPLGIYKHLKIKSGIDAGDQLEDMVWTLKHTFDRHIDSNGAEGRTFALNAAKVINGTIANILKLKQVMGEESEAIHKKRQEIEGVGHNPANIAELTMKLTLICGTSSFVVP